MVNVTAAELERNLDEEPGTRAPLVLGSTEFTQITEVVSRPVEWKAPRAWYIYMGCCGALVALLLFCIGQLIWNGTGVWGLQQPVGWAWDITNFVFWVGIGHAGTLISAILFLFRQQWRTSINRFAEAMTLFAVVCALMFPTIHVGRIWLRQVLSPR